ncbi:adenylate/guanylate cyclase domain-containing protein [Fischerella thermalis]|uniref:adenylate/guanylate cyclase domain-containing protein n=1 Tax=Fischerella thermalis TaxID=372787 RepID=UPI0003025848|nr:adenylate/guanylate cyclase domain-containing protein [Fischerella thermalis]RDH51160.1 hypothetical protein CBF18_10380 [Mastigocladus laminosus WC112]
MSIGHGEKITHDHQLPITHYQLPTPTDNSKCSSGHDMNGLPARHPNHFQAIAHMALDMLDAITKLPLPL